MARSVATLVQDLDALQKKLDRRSADANRSITWLQSLSNECAAIVQELKLRLQAPDAPAQPLPLSEVTGDFESLLYQITSRVAAKGTWKDFLTSSTGVTLLEQPAAIGVYNQYNIELAFREAFPSHARRDSSIYAAARMLGVKVQRKYPGAITVALTNKAPAPQVLPQRSQIISSNQAAFFTRSTVTLATGETRTVPVCSGTPKTATFTVPDVPFMEYVLPEPGFTVSGDPQDFRVYVTDAAGVQSAWEPTDQPLWNHGPNDRVYYDNTTGDGAVSIIFGDGLYGMAPTPGGTITVEYSTLNGLEITGATIGLTVTVPRFKDVSATITGVAQESIEPKSAQYYKVYAPHIFKARGRAINKTDYMAIILSHPEVASCAVHGQRDLYPNDPKWMNTVRVCVLPVSVDSWGGINPNPQSTKWTQFMEWLRPKLHEAVQIQTWNPTPLGVDLIVKVALKQAAVYDSAYTQISSNLELLFRRDTYSLGKTVYLSDIEDACRVAETDYIQVVSPSRDIVPLDAYTYVTLTSLTLSVFYSERKSLPTYR